MARKRKKQKNKSRNILLYPLIICLAAVLAVITAFRLYLYYLPPINNFDDIKPNPVTSIYSSDGELIKTFTAFKFEKIDIEDVPVDLKNAIISIEDKKFYSHEGYDPVGLVRSVIVNVMAGRAKQGASTITQQLARILFLSNEKTFTRKIKEIILAHRIEKTISKDEILEMYLNSVYLGSGSYGVLGASKTYFDKELDELTLAESALIAGLPQAPSVYSPLNNPEKALNRRDQVLKRMYKNGYIKKEQYEAAKKEELTLNTKPRLYSYNKAPYFVDYVLKELDDLGFDEMEISQGGLKIYTTVDYNSQMAAHDAIVANLEAAGLTKDKTQGALFSFSPTSGRIYAYVGGKNYEKSQYDRVTNAIRPPGSSFKPFVYTAALQRGYSPFDKIEDAPIQVTKKWAPKNYGGKYRGEIPMWLAVAVSSNVCAVQTIQKVGVDAVINLAHAMGITTPLQHDMTIALGSNGVKLFDMVVAYGSFANGGFRVKPYSVERVENAHGIVLYEHGAPIVSKVIAYETAADMTYMLKKVIKNGTGMAANIGKDAAGKTGTTDDYRDAWFMGYTPDLVTGVWIGNDDNSKLGGAFTGGGAPAKIWRSYMNVATTNFKNSVFDYPEIEEPIEIEEVDETTEEIVEDNIEVEDTDNNFLDVFFGDDNKKEEKSDVPKDFDSTLPPVKQEAPKVKPVEKQFSEKLPTPPKAQELPLVETETEETAPPLPVGG